MADDKINSVVSDRALRQLEEMNAMLIEGAQLVVEFNNATKAGEIKVSGSDSISTLNKNIKDALTNFDKLSSASKKYNTTAAQSEKINLADAKARYEVAKALDKEASARLKNAKAAEYEQRLKERLEKQYEKNAKAIAKETKALDALSDEYGIISKAYNEAARRAKNYQLTLGETHPIALEATADAKALGAQLMKLDASVGQHTRNVGNYASANLELQYILRDLPSFANGVHVGLMGISNNISPLFDKLEMLRKTGMSNAQIFKDMARSFISFNGILSLVVAGVTILAASWDKLTESTDKAKQAQDKAIDGFIDEKTALQTLNMEILNSATSNERLLQIKEVLISKYPGLNKLIDDEGDLQFQLSKAVRTATEALKEQSIIRGAQELLAEETKKMLKGEVDAWDLLSTAVMGSIVGLPQAIADQSVKSAKEYEKTFDRLSKIIEDAQARLRAKGLDTFFDAKAVKESVGKAVDEVKKELNIKLSTALNADPSMIISEAQQAATKLAQLQLEEATRLRMLQESYTEGLISYEEYQEGKGQIAKKVTTEILRLQLAELNAAKQQAGLSAEQIAELERQITSVSNKIAEINGSGANGGKVPFTDKDGLDVAKEYINAYTQIAYLIGQAGDRRIQALRKQQEESDKLEQREIARLERTGASEEEIAKAQARFDSERAKREQEAIALQRRKAAFEKSAAMLQIGLSTYQAVMKTYAEYGGTPFGVAAAVAVGIAGAAQLAAAASAPLPQYAEGTQHHKGGAFIAGEAGERELVVRPDNKAYWTDKVAGIYNEPKGTRVIPESKLLSMPALGGGVSMQKRGDTINIFDDKRIVRAINNNKPVVNINVSNGSKVKHWTA